MIESTLQKYIQFWNQRENLFSLAKEETQDQKNARVEIQKALLAIFFIISCVVLMTADAIYGSHVAFSILGLGFFSALFIMFKSISKNKKIKAANKIEINNLKQELKDKSHANSIFSFLLPYIEKNQNKKLLLLNKLIYKLEINEINTEELLLFIRINKEVINDIKIQEHEELIKNKVELFLKKNEVKINIDDNYSKDTVKQKYLEML